MDAQTNPPRWRMTLTYTAESGLAPVTRLAADQDEVRDMIDDDPHAAEILFIDLVLIPRRQPEQAA